MPAGDRTGPMGMGPRTGRSAGYCGGYRVPGYANPGPRMGMGWRRGWGAPTYSGWGGGRGWRHRYYATGAPYWARHDYAPPFEASAGYAPYGAPPTKEEEVEALRREAEWLQESLEAITARMDELEGHEA